MSSKSSESGYNMVMLIMAVTILNIMVAAVLPLMSTDIQRQKEEELVFRGFQYAEAIRVFRRNHGGVYPTKLADLLEMKPRSIRQLWKDPMTKDGKWGLIYQGGVTTPPTGPAGGPDNPPPPDPKKPVDPKNPPKDPKDPEAQDPEGTESGGFNTPKPGEVVATGPIIGVYSKSRGKSHLIFYGHEHYNEWQFTETLISGGGNGTQPGGGRLSFSTRWLGRPMPFNNPLQPQNSTGPSSDPTTSSGPTKKP